MASQSAALRHCLRIAFPIKFTALCRRMTLRGSFVCQLCLGEPRHVSAVYFLAPAFTAELYIATLGRWAGLKNVRLQFLANSL